MIVLLCKFVDVPVQNDHVSCCLAGCLLVCRLKFYLRQQCAAAVLRVMEAAATTGVVCRLMNVRNVDTARLLFPKLVAMNLDQPEAQLFFGHQNKQSCSYCRRRKGRSAFRASTRQSGTMVHRLYDIANGPDSVFRDMARAQATEEMRVELEAQMLFGECLPQLVRTDTW